MGLKRFVHKDGKYAWYNDEKHKLEDGELVPLKGASKAAESVEEEEPKKKSRRSRR